MPSGQPVLSHSFQVSLNFTADEKLAFWVNTYNLLCFHALITRIHAKATNPIAGYWERLSFFQEIQYVIGSYLFSLDDIKNGILRSMSRVSLFPI